MPSLISQWLGWLQYLSRSSRTISVFCATISVALSYISVSAHTARKLRGEKIYDHRRYLITTIYLMVKFSCCESGCEKRRVHKSAKCNVRQERTLPKASQAHIASHWGDMSHVPLVIVTVSPRSDVDDEQQMSQS